MKHKKRVLTSDQPTGPLHLGQYLGTLKNCIKFQDKYECFFAITDLQALNSHLMDSTTIRNNIFEIMCDYLSVGLHPENTFFIQSQVPELAELTMYLSPLITVSRLQQNQTIKNEMKIYDVKNINYGFLGRPLSQTVNILAFKTDFVVIGYDELPLFQETRKIASSFNRVFGQRVFTLPQPILSECPMLVGTDGKNKMSKSLDNFIAFAHSPEETKYRILNMVTDYKRVYLKDPGHPDECFAFKYWCLFAPIDTPEIRQKCETASWGCKKCKEQLAQCLNECLSEIRERRQYYASQPDIIWNVLDRGTRRAREIATETLEEVREVIKLSYPELKRIRYKNKDLLKLYKPQQRYVPQPVKKERKIPKPSFPKLKRKESEMLIVDFTKLTSEQVNMTMQQAGISDLNHLSLLTVLKYLKLGSNKVPQEYFPARKQLGHTGHISIQAEIQELRKVKKIIDVIGPIKVQRGTPVCFSTLVSLHPKTYLNQYIEIARILCKENTGLCFTVWLEDTFTALKKRWSKATTLKAVNAYQTFFTNEFPRLQLLVSSEIAPLGIPRSFAEEKLSSITGKEFLSVMPFHLRHPMFVKVLDVVHFAWNCYVLYRYPGIYLAGINNKRHFQLFRKIIGENITAVLVPLFPEENLG